MRSGQPKWLSDWEHLHGTREHPRWQVLLALPVLGGERQLERQLGGRLEAPWGAAAGGVDVMVDRRETRRRGDRRLLVEEIALERRRDVGGRVRGVRRATQGATQRGEKVGLRAGSSLGFGLGSKFRARVRVKVRVVALHWGVGRGAGGAAPARR